MVFRRVLFSLSFFILTHISGAGFAEDHFTGTGGSASTPKSTPTATGAGRGEASEKLTANEVTILKDGFNATEDFIRTQWDTKLPKAIETAVKDHKEDDVAGVFAKLVGTINNKQLDSMFEKVVGEAKKLEKGGSRYAEILKRMMWVKEIISPSANPSELPFPAVGEEFNRFRAAFQTKFGEVRRSNQAFYDLLKEALANGPGKQAAIEKLRTYNPQMLLTFLGAQAKSGNDTLANQLGQALAFSENGRNFLDGVTKDGKSVRIHADGNNFASAVRDFERTNGPITAVNFSPTKHSDTPQISFDGRTGQTLITPPRPLLVPAPIQKDTPKINEPKETPKDTSRDTTPKQIQKEVERPKVDGTDAKVLPMLTRDCKSCHDPADRDNFSGNFDITGILNGTTGTMDRAKVQRIYNRAVLGIRGTNNNRFMPPGTTASISVADQAAITEWARLNGANLTP